MAVGLVHQHPDVDEHQNPDDDVEVGVGDLRQTEAMLERH